MSTTDSIKTQETTPHIDYHSMSGGELLAALGQDARKWAEAFVQIKSKQGWGLDDIDVGLMTTWFANAIVTAEDAQRALVDQLYAKLTCCCGRYVADHGMGDGHSPVAMYDYALHNAEERIKHLEARADPVIRLTCTEVQSGHDRQKWAEGLILQLPADHDGRNSWLLNYGVSDEAKARREKRGLDFNSVSRAVNPPADR